MAAAGREIKPSLGKGASGRQHCITRLINSEERSSSNDELSMTAASFRGILMQEHHELMEFNEHLIDADITCAIRYLDPDSCTDKIGKGPGTVVGICINLLTAFTAALDIFLPLCSDTLKAHIRQAARVDSD